MARKRIYDAYCCDGGAAMGYHRAGFEVVGVDIEPHPNYPFEFHRGDAVEFIREHGHEFDAGHGSPPCQGGSTLTRGNRKRDGWKDDHVNLIPDTRAAMVATGKPYVIENVAGFRRELIDPIRLCGLTFQRPIYRHRFFELGGWSMEEPPHPSHKGHRTRGWRHGVFYDGDILAIYGEGGGKGSIAEWQAALGISWSDSRRYLAESIPPDYTELIGRQLMAFLEEN